MPSAICSQELLPKGHYTNSHDLDVANNLAALREDALQESQARLEALFKNIQDALLLMDDAGQCVDANPAAAAIFGYTHEEFLRLSICDLLPLPTAETLQRWARFLTAGKFTEEIVGIHKDGGQIDLDCRAVANILPGLHLAVIQDIVERKWSEAALRESEARFRQLTQHIHDVFWIASVDVSQIFYVSPGCEEIWGVPSSTLYADPFLWGRSIHPDDYPRVQAALHSFGSAGFFDEEYRVVREDGSIRWVHTRGFPFRDENQEVQQMAGITQDITAHKREEEALKRAREEAECARREAERLQQEAERANYAKSDFLSRMSHELRTPLNAILGFGQLLQLDAHNARDKESLNHILKAGAHLLQLINEVLDISRIESGHLTVSLEPVQVSDALQQSLEMVSPMAAAANIQLYTMHDGCRQFVQADRQRLNQVLLNLLSNAIKYNRKEGTVRIKCEETEKRLRIRVIDTGPGIPPEGLAKLFVPFERIGAEHTEIEGTGIGLALSKKLVELMDGSIGVESTPGQGSCFWVEFPIAQDPFQQMKNLDSSSEDSTPEDRKEGVMLYVEDNISNLRLVELMLEQRPGVQLLTTMQGSLALDLARQHHPDIIFLDLHLPDTRGDEVLKRLQESPVTRSIPVVIVSADATAGQIQRLKLMGAKDYLTKPINVRQFFRILDEVLAARNPTSSADPA